MSANFLSFDADRVPLLNATQRVVWSYATNSTVGTVHDVTELNLGQYLYPNPKPEWKMSKAIEKCWAVINAGGTIVVWKETEAEAQQEARRRASKEEDAFWVAKIVFGARPKPTDIEDVQV